MDDEKRKQVKGFYQGLLKKPAAGAGPAGGADVRKTATDKKGPVINGTGVNAPSTATAANSKNIAQGLEDEINETVE